MDTGERVIQVKHVQTRMKESYRWRWVLGTDDRTYYLRNLEGVIEVGTLLLVKPERDPGLTSLFTLVKVL